MRMKLKPSLLAIIPFLFCIAPGLRAEEQLLPVFVTIAPQRAFVKEIGKDLVDVQILVEPGADPHTYEPKPRQMVALSKARLYFAIGIGFEAAKLDRITAMNPKIKVVHTDHGIQKLSMAHHHEGDHAHEGTGHTDAGQADKKRLDPHIWLSPPLVMFQARSILTALQAADPGHRREYEKNYRAFMVSLIDLDARLRKTFEGCKGAAFMVFHPSWGTFAHAYGLKQVPIEVEGKSPKPAQLKELIEYAQARRIKAVFVQPQFSSKSARQVAEAIGGQTIAVDPLEEAWAANLIRVAEEFKHAFE